MCRLIDVGVFVIVYFQTMLTYPAAA